MDIERRHGVVELEREMERLREAHEQLSVRVDALLSDFRGHDQWEKKWRDEIEKILTQYRALRLVFVFLFGLAGVVGGLISVASSIKEHWR